MRRAGALLAGALSLMGCHGPERGLRFGTTTTVEQSGALTVVDSLWRGAPIQKVIGGSGQILRAAAAGDLDIVITHAPALEAKWLGADRVALRCPFVASRFAVVGPASDPAGVARATSAADAMRRIAQRQVVFVSRGDSSGTHMKELALWQRARIRPHGAPWYVESGSGQAATLTIADERRGYALADLPTLVHVQDLRLRPLFTADPDLANPYTLYLIRRNPEHPAARQFVTWALSTWRDHLTAEKLLDGSSPFTRRADTCGGNSPKKAAAGARR